MKSNLTILKRFELPIGAYVAMMAIAITSGFLLGREVPKIKADPLPQLPTFETVITVSSNAPKYLNPACLWTLAPDTKIFCHGDYVVEDAASGPGFEIAGGARFTPLMYRIMRGSDIGSVWVSQMDVENVYIRAIGKKEESQ